MTIKKMGCEEGKEKRMGIRRVAGGGERKRGRRRGKETWETENYNQKRVAVGTRARLAGGGR
jgi:hypothetical protein